MEVLQEAKERFEKAVAHYAEEYQRGDDDVEFLFDQWDQSDRDLRKNEGRPCLQENRLSPFVDQVVNDAREMRPAVKVQPVDDLADKETAKVFKGLIRNIERQSKADIAYDTAMQNSVTSGYGWIRINTTYSDPLSFSQEARIEAVPDRKSCMLDPSSVEPDGSDADWGFIYSDINTEVFKDQHPDADPVDFEGAERDGWKTENTVRIVEYFYKKYTNVTIKECFLPDGTVSVLTDEQVKQLDDANIEYTVLRERKTRTHVVKWCKLTGAEELEATEWLGQYIPIVPVYGKLYWKDGRLRSYSLLTNAKDPQKRLNIIITTEAEIVASQPKTQPYIGAVGQFATDGNAWASANTDNPAYLQYDPTWVTDEVTGQSVLAPPPQKSQPMMVSPALMQLEQSASMGINASLGMYEENRGDESNAISGVAIRSRQVRGDRATYHFKDNLSASIRHVGVILVDLLPKLYTQKTIDRILGDDGKEQNVTIDPTVERSGNGIFNLGAGKYDVDVDVGPSYATQQQEFLDISKELMKVSPEYIAIAGDKVIESAGGPYADIIAERIRANNPLMQSDDPMAVKVMEAMQKLKAAEDQNLTLMAALDEKKKNEELANQIDAGELKIKAFGAETDRMEAVAKIKQIGLQAQGAQSEALADIVDAISEIAGMVTDQNNTISLMLDQAERATGQPTQ